MTLNGTAFAVSLVFFGIGAGLLMSQLGNVIMSSVPPEETNEAGGLQGTAQNLGASLGTALIGSVLLLGLLNGFNSRIQENPALPADVKAQICGRHRGRHRRSSRPSRRTRRCSTPGWRRPRQTLSRLTTATPSSTR